MEEMVACVAQDVLGTQVVTYGDTRSILTPPWRRLTIRDALLEYADLDIAESPFGGQHCGCSESRAALRCDDDVDTRRSGRRVGERVGRTQPDTADFSDGLSGRLPGKPPGETKAG